MRDRIYVTDERNITELYWLLKGFGIEVGQFNRLFDYIIFRNSEKPKVQLVMYNQENPEELVTLNFYDEEGQFIKSQHKLSEEVWKMACLIWPEEHIDGGES